jgi:tetratricopeptide (TPR) repeat protein
VRSEESGVRPSALARVDSLRIAYQADSALAEIGRLLPRARASPDSLLLLQLLLRQGELETSLGRPAHGEPALREAIALAETVPDSLLLCASVRWLAVASGNQGRIEESAALYDRLLSLATAIGDARHEGWARVGRAWIASFRGRDADAAREYRLAVDLLAESGDRRGEAWAWNGLGVARERLGDYGEARGCYEGVLRLARSLGHPPLESMALNNLGSLALALGDPGEALDHFEEALRLQRRVGNQRGAFEPALNIAICQSQLGRYGEAETSLERLQNDCRTLGYRQLEGIVLNQQAELSRHRGRDHRAAERNRRTLALGDVIPLRTRADARIGLARALAGIDSCEAALRELEEGAREIRGSGLSELELTFAREEGALLQTTGQHEEALGRLLAADRAAERLGLTGHRVECLARAARSSGELGLPDSSLALLRRAAAIWEAERAQPLDPEWREQRGVSGQLVYTALAVRILEDPKRERSDAVREAFDQLQVFKARTLLERMLGPHHAATARPPEAREPISLETLQGILAERELFLDAYLGPERSVLFAVTRSECRAVLLPSESELRSRILPLYGLLALSPDPAGAESDGTILRAAGARLGDVVLGGVRDLVEQSRLVTYAPDGTLNLVPLVALNPDGPAANGGPAWARVPSATVLAHLRDRASGTEPATTDRVLAVAGTTTPSGGRLVGAVREVRHLGARFRGVEVRTLDESAAPGTTAVTAATLAGYGVLHIAAHAGVNDEYPWRSAIRLGPGGERDRLLAADIAAARLPARLVVLAACDTGGGRVLSGEGVLGLSSAFLGAGVPAVLATLWPVDDAATELLMRAFYRELSDGRRAATALQEAQAILRNDPATEDPFFWAGFVLIGDGEIEVPLERRPAFPGPALVLVGGAAFLAWAARRAQNRRPRL